MRAGRRSRDRVILACAAGFASLCAGAPVRAAMLAHVLSGYYLLAPAPNAIVAVRTTEIVPVEPPASGTVFEWAGLDPFDGPTLRPIDNGVLQPVLTWGRSCAPGDQPLPYSTWWISAQYVNTFGTLSEYAGCRGGPIMPVAVGDALRESLVVRGTLWTETVVDLRTRRHVAFTIDLHGQQQQVFYVQTESDGQNPVGAIAYRDTSVTFALPPANGCGLAKNGTPDPDDTFTPPVVSNGGRTCAYAWIVVRSPFPPLRAEAQRIDVRA